MEKPGVGKAQAESANSVIPSQPQKIPHTPWAVPCAAPSASSSEVGCSTWPSSHRGVSFAKAMTRMELQGWELAMTSARGLKQPTKIIQTWNTTNGKQGCKRLRSSNNYGKKAWFEWFAAKNEGLFVGQIIFGIPTI